MLTELNILNHSQKRLKRMAIAIILNTEKLMAIGVST